MLTALGGCVPRLEAPLNAALNVGLAPDGIVETLLHTAVYCGMSETLNATVVAKNVFAARGVRPHASSGDAERRHNQMLHIGCSIQG